MSTSRVAALCSLTLVLPTTAAAADPFAAHVVQAAGLMVEGRLEDAIGELTRARRVKALPELDAMVGLAALQGGEPMLAARQLESAISRGSTEPLVFYWSARAELAARRRSAALRRLRQALAIADQPAIHVAYAMLAPTDEACGSLVAAARRQPNLLEPSLYPTATQGAVELMGRILATFPAKLQLLRTEGHLLWRAGRVSAACERFERLLRERPADADALQMQARCLAAVGRTEAALQLAARALKSAPGSFQALATRGEILLELGQAARAVKDLRRAADGLPRDGRLLTRLAQACTEAEKPTCARTFFDHALRQQPDNAAAAFGLALHLAQQKKSTEQALQMFRTALRLAPAQPRYWRAAADFAAQQGERATARRWLVEARQAQRMQRRLQRVHKQMARIAKVASQLRQCDGKCQRLADRLPLPARQMLQIHLATTRKQTARARELATALRPALGPQQLLLKDPTLYQLKGRTVSGQSYVVRTSFPYVPPWRLAAPHPVK